MKLLFLLGTLALCALISISCADGRDGSSATRPSATTTVEATAFTGGGGGATFATASQLAHYVKQDIIVPVGVPLGGVQTEEGTGGALANYGYWIFGGAGDLWVFGAAPRSVADFDTALLHNADFVEVRRSLVQVQSGEALLIQERHRTYSAHDSFRLLWAVNGLVVQAETATASTGESNPTIGSDALIGLANATRLVPLSEVDKVGILQEDRSAGRLSGEISTVSSVSAAGALYGAPVSAPPMLAFIHVLHAGVLKSYTIDLDDKGLQRIFLSPESPADVAASDPEAQPAGDAGGMDVFERRDTTAGATSLLFFSGAGQNFMIRDANGGSAADLEAIALSIRSRVDGATPVPPAPTPGSGNVMSLDADASTPAIVDASRAVTGSAPFSVGINVTAAADAYEGYQWEIEYPGSSLAFEGAVSEQTRATGMTICTASVVNGSATPLTRGDTVYGGGAGCITASGIATNYTGETTTFNMRCLAAGSFSVQLVGALQDPSFGTTLITPGGGSADTATAAITITCA